MNQKFWDRDEDDQTLLMTRNNILQICDNDGLSEFPELNTKLYLHFKGFKKISNLDDFYNVKVLWLENN